ncbi:PREDICTED: uncharacterized protein LOC105556695 isoform X2 [Vollenhovia emeryi]|uniref:uncharacterized protein LOC105556695 isoform X2 n=1 Tax=Vollenhovia emeryi TaxID=411798 RepID=UPI0005F40A4A|nr:PREDICTED: uncharacterized protein LOC105556695 isoform X2 [Vollenhovia emeryi]
MHNRGHNLPRTEIRTDGEVKGLRTKFREDVKRGNELVSGPPRRDTMSDDSLPHISYGLDSRGRIVRIESGITRANIRRLPSIEEALRRLSTNLRSDRQASDSNNGNTRDSFARSGENLRTVLVDVRTVSIC